MVLTDGAVSRKEGAMAGGELLGLPVIVASVIPAQKNMSNTDKEQKSGNNA